MCNRKISTLVVAAVVTTTLVSSMAQAQIRYVDDGASLGGDGLTWGTAYRFLQDALAFASVPANGVTEIRVAQGTYLPDRSEADPDGSCTPGPCNRAATFQLINGVALRGGFAGIGAPDPDAQDILFETIVQL